MVTADAIRRQGLRCTPFQPCTNDKRCTLLVLAVRPCFCKTNVSGSARIIKRFF